MQVKEIISYEEVLGKTFKIRVVEANDNGQAALTHYFHNQHNGISEIYKKEAVTHIKRALEYKFPDEVITLKAAEEALQYLLFDFKNDIPFPEPKKSKFTFIDLFAGIGGFRLAMQNLGGKCLFTSEWDEQAKKTYAANFGEVPFGDITKLETKSIIPDDFDVLGVPLSGRAFRSNLFVRPSHKGFPLQSLTQKTA